MTTNLFIAAGITDSYKGVAKVRFTNDVVTRIKRVAKDSSVRADYVDLPEAMDKISALKFLQTHPKFQSEEDQATIEDALVAKEKFTKPKREVKVKASLEDIAARPRNDDVTVADILNAVTEE